MSSTQQLTTNTSNDDMLDEIPQPSVVNYQNQANNSDSDESFKTVENFVPVKLNFIKKLATTSGKIPRSDLEELVLLKVTESMVYRTKYAEIRVQLEQYEELMQRQKARIELLEKQYTDLEVTHERILTAMRENPNAPIEPLKIVRGVSCQVYQPTEIVNSMPDPIVIGDSPKKTRTRRRNATGKGKKNLNKVTEITIDSSDEDEEVGDEKVTRSREKNQEKSKENKNSENGSSSIQKDTSSSKNEEPKSSNNNETEVAKNQSKSCETQTNFDDSKQTSSNSDPDSSKSSNKKSKDHQVPQNPSNIENKSLKADQISTSSTETSTGSSNESTKLKEGNKRGRKRKATTILDMIEKRPKNIPENTKNESSTNISENGTKNNSKSSKDSDSDNDVTLIEDDVEEPKTKRHQTSNYSELDIELPRVLEKLANISKHRESNNKTDPKLANITSKLNGLISKISETPKQRNSFSTSPELNIGSPESASTSSPESIPVQKSFKVPSVKPKARPGPKCSKVSNQSEKLESLPQGSGSLLKVSEKFMNGRSNLQNGVKNPQNGVQNPQNGVKNPQNGVHNQRLTQYHPPSATKIRSSPLDSATKSSHLDQSFDSLNFSTSTFDSLSSFKPSANLVTSTPLKVADHGPVMAVKRTLNLNFNEKHSNKIPGLPPRGPQILHPRLKQLVPAPTIKVEKVNNGIKISWKIDNFKPSDHADIQTYQIYVFEEVSGNVKLSSADWKLIGDVKALLLPMAVTLREFNEDQKFHFAIRAVDVHKRVGDFSEPKSWD